MTYKGEKYDMTTNERKPAVGRWREGEGQEQFVARPRWLAVVSWKAYPLRTVIPEHRSYDREDCKHIHQITWINNSKYIFDVETVAG